MDDKCSILESSMPKCPHCNKELTGDEIKSLWGAYTSDQRITKTGGRMGGRPKKKPELPVARKKKAKAAKKL